MDTPPSLPPPVPAKSSKKWIFFGCGGCLALLLLGAIVVAVIFFGILGVIKSSAPYQSALAGAQNSAEVQQELGTPIKAGLLPTGSVNVTDDTGTAEIDIPISGPKGSGDVHYKATRSDGKWNVEDFKVTINGTGKVIDLSQ